MSQGHPSTCCLFCKTEANLINEMPTKLLLVIKKVSIYKNATQNSRICEMCFAFLKSRCAELQKKRIERRNNMTQLASNLNERMDSDDDTDAVLPQQPITLPNKRNQTARKRKQSVKQAAKFYRKTNFRSKNILYMDSCSDSSDASFIAEQSSSESTSTTQSDDISSIDAFLDTMSQQSTTKNIKMSQAQPSIYCLFCKTKANLISNMSTKLLMVIRRITIYKNVTQNDRICEMCLVIFKSRCAALQKKRIKRRNNMAILAAENKRREMIAQQNLIERMDSGDETGAIAIVPHQLIKPANESVGSKHKCHRSALGRTTKPDRRTNFRHKNNLSLDSYSNSSDASFIAEQSSSESASTTQSDGISSVDAFLDTVPPMIFSDNAMYPRVTGG